MKKLIIIVGVIISMIFTFTLLGNESYFDFTAEEKHNERDWFNAQVDKVHLEIDEFYLYKNGELFENDVKLKKGKSTYTFESGIETKRGIKKGSSVEQFAEAYDDIPYIISNDARSILYKEIKNCYDYDQNIENYRKYEPYYIMFQSVFQNSIYASSEEINNIKKQNEAITIKMNQGNNFEIYQLMFEIENGIVSDIAYGQPEYSN